MKKNYNPDGTQETSLVGVKFEGQDKQFKPFSPRPTIGSLRSVGGNTIVTYEDNLSDLFNYIQGRVLTIIDASIADKQQNEAIKDLLRQAIWGTAESIYVLPVKKI